MKEQALRLANDLETHDKKSLFYSFLVSQSADMIRKLVDEIDCWKLTAQHHEFMSRHLGIIAKERQEMMKPLNDDELLKLYKECMESPYKHQQSYFGFAKAIEKAHGIK